MRFNDGKRLNRRKIRRGLSKVSIPTTGTSSSEGDISMTMLPKTMTKSKMFQGDIQKSLNQNDSMFTASSTMKMSVNVYLRLCVHTKTALEKAKGFVRSTPKR